MGVSVSVSVSVSVRVRVGEGVLGSVRELLGSCLGDDGQRWKG